MQMNINNNSRSKILKSLCFFLVWTTKSTTKAAFCGGTPPSCTDIFTKRYFDTGNFNPAQGPLRQCFDSPCIAAGCSCTNERDKNGGPFGYGDGTIRCTGRANSCRAYDNEDDCRGGCNWIDGPTESPTAPPPPTALPSEAPTTRCDQGFTIRLYSDYQEPPLGMHVVDLNGDGKMDRLGFERNENGDTILFRHHETIVKQVIDDTNDDLTDLATTDLDGDGLVDIVYTESSSRLIFPDCYYYGSIGWYRNLGNGQFADPTKLSTGRRLRGAGKIEVADVDGDNLPDLVVVYRNERRSILTWCKNLGNGLVSQDYPVIDNILGYVGSLTIGDANSDGKMDILVSASTYPVKTSLYINNGDDTFTESIITSASTEAVKLHYSRFVDIDSNGVLDVVGSSKNGVYWFENQGDGTSYTEHYLAVTSKAFDTMDISVNFPVSTADINGDGLLDILVGGRSNIPNQVIDGSQGYQYWIVLFENRGNIIFQDRAIAVPGSSYGIDFMDMNNDGFLDIIREGYWLETLDECFMEVSPSETITPAPAPSPNLNSHGYPYVQAYSSNAGWLLWHPNLEDGSTIEYNVTFSVEDCAVKCQAEDAPHGSWNSRWNICWCYFVPAGGLCKEPCLQEDGVDFSRIIPFADIKDCEESFCHKDWYHSKDYCDDFHNYDQIACNAKMLEKDKEKASSSNSQRSIKTMAIALISALVLL